MSSLMMMGSLSSEVLFWLGAVEVGDIIFAAHAVVLVAAVGDDTIIFLVSAEFLVSADDDDCC